MKKIEKLLTITIFSTISCLCLFSGCQNKGTSLQYELHSTGEYYIVTGKMDKTSKKLEIPNEYKGLPVREIADNAFANWLELDSLTIPTSITRIGDNAFYGCKNMQNLSFENPKIGDDTPNGKYDGFFTEGYLEIGNSAFENCDKLTKVIFGTMVKKIGNRAFYDCDNLIDFSIGRYVEEIGADAFLECENIITLFVAEQNEYYYSIDGVLYDEETMEIFFCPEERSKKVTQDEYEFAFTKEALFNVTAYMQFKRDGITSYLYSVGENYALCSYSEGAQYYGRYYGLAKEVEFAYTYGNESLEDFTEDQAVWTKRDNPSYYATKGINEIFSYQREYSLLEYDKETKTYVYENTAYGTTFRYFFSFQDKKLIKYEIFEWDEKVFSMCLYDYETTEIPQEIVAIKDRK